MFFNKLALFATASMAVFVAAAPSPTGRRTKDSCRTGSVQCCNAIKSKHSEEVKTAYSLLGLDALLGTVTGDVGLGCSPIGVLGLGSGNSCSSQPVCCNGNTFGGLIATGCSSFDVNI